MTISSTPSHSVSESSIVDIMAVKQSIEVRLLAINSQIESLMVERQVQTAKGYQIEQRLQRQIMASRPIARLPIREISMFLTAKDLCTLQQTCSHFVEVCSPGGKLIVSHLGEVSTSMTESQARQLVTKLFLGGVSSLSVDGRKKGQLSLLAALAPYGAELFNLRRLSVNAAAESGSIMGFVSQFFTGLKVNQLRSLHLSGFRQLSSISSLIRKQSGSITCFKADYFVNGHEQEVTADHIPSFPRLRSFALDVADVSEISASLLYSRLDAIKDKASFTELYLPHVQISGDSAKIASVIRLLKKFPNLQQVVLRFHHMPLSIREIIQIREDLQRLPACCISDHFIVALQCWAPWWPRMDEVWSKLKDIDGLAVFKEQIDFESLGSTAEREWNKLSDERKAFWSEKVALSVRSLYRKTIRRALLSGMFAQGISNDETMQDPFAFPKAIDHAFTEVTPSPVHSNTSTATDSVSFNLTASRRNAITHIDPSDLIRIASMSRGEPITPPNSIAADEEESAPSSPRRAGLTRRENAITNSSSGNMVTAEGVAAILRSLNNPSARGA